MLERIITLVLVLLFSYLIIKKFSRKKISREKLHLDLSNVNPFLPTILYFWSEDCVQCRTIQKPAIQKLQKEGKKFNFVPVNAIEELDLTKKLNIKTLPSTVVINSGKNIQFINNGYAADSTLKKQLEELR
jgi:thioredoxin-like negative regulator of GroEL